VRTRTANGLERLRGEIKRRIRAVGVFPDRDSALHLVTALALHAAATWDDRRYSDTSLLEASTSNDNKARGEIAVRGLHLFTFTPRMDLTYASRIHCRSM
jgi:hypothetical protein